MLEVVEGRIVSTPVQTPEVRLVAEVRAGREGCDNQKQCGGKWLLLADTTDDRHRVDGVKASRSAETLILWPAHVRASLRCPDKG